MKIEGYEHAYEETSRHGKVSAFYRAGGRGPRIYLPPKEAPEFAAAYADAVAGRATKEREPAPPPVIPKTFGWLCQQYRASTTFERLDLTTRDKRGKIIDKMLAEPIAPEHPYKLFSDYPLDRLRLKALRVLRDRKKKFPCAANERVKSLRAIFKWGLENEEDVVEYNPARDLTYLQPKPSDGHHSWALAEVKKYWERHPIGTKAHLALAMFLYSVQRISDVSRMGPPMVRTETLYDEETGASETLEGIGFRQHKNRNRKPVDLWLPLLPELRRIIQATKVVGTQTWLVTEYGKPFTTKGLQNKMRTWCDDAGLPHCTAPGMRKASSALIAELGATDRQLMGASGHQTAQQVDLYTRGVRQKKMAVAAMRRLSKIQLG